jgi:hypothetical protein
MWNSFNSDKILRAFEVKDNNCILLCNKSN